MTFDLRLPIGLLFAGIGLLLAGFGAAAPARATSLGVNVDLVWGGALLVGGVLLTAAVLFGRRAGGRA